VGTQLLPVSGTAAAPILAHVYCGQMDGWIKIPLGTDVGLGTGHVLHVYPALPTAASSTFGPCLL